MFSTVEDIMIHVGDIIRIVGDVHCPHTFHVKCDGGYHDASVGIPVPWGRGVFSTSTLFMMSLDGR